MQRCSLAIFPLKKPTRHVSPPQKCQNGWNGTACEVASMRWQAQNLHEAIWFFHPNMSPELITTGGGQGAVLIRGPLSAQRKEAEYERRWKRRQGGVWGNECVKTGVPRMSQHWKQPMISSGDGFRVQFSSCKLSGFAWVCTSLHV